MLQLKEGGDQLSSAAAVLEENVGFVDSWGQLCGEGGGAHD